MNVIDIKRLDEIVANAMRKVEEETDMWNRKSEEVFYLSEGIKVSERNGKGYVSYDPSNEDLVDTSIENNPTQYLIQGVPVISIFKRKAGKTFFGTDGNPLLHALKKECNWYFESDNDRRLIFQQILGILNKFKEEHTFKTTLIVPTTNSLNGVIANLYQEINPDSTIIRRMFFKMDTTEVYNEIMNPGSLFKKHYAKNVGEAVNKLVLYLENMNNRNKGVFSYHFVHDAEMRSVIQKTLKLCDNPMGQYGDIINGSDVLLIDDTVSQGNTLKQCAELIKATFTPKSITALTLFSPLTK